MKRLISILISIVFLFNTCFAYTVTLRIKRMNLVTEVESGKTVDILPKAPDITGWKVVEGDITLENDSFVMPEKNVVIEAITPKYLLTINSLFFSKLEHKYEGDMVTVEAMTENSNYKFNGWVESGMELSDEQRMSPSITFEMPGNEVTLTAQYIINT